MRHLIRHQIGVHVLHRGVSQTASFRRSALLCALALPLLCKVHAQPTEDEPKLHDSEHPVAECLPNGAAFLESRLDGALKAELKWGAAELECTGAVRPTDGGIRLRFRSALPSGEKLVLLFGIANLREGTDAKNVPVNLTVIREGTGEFYGTRGDDKCMLDEVRQGPIVGIPHRSRVYELVARGYCTEPARAIRGSGAVLVSRFDFAGRVDFETEDKAEQEP
jgi:hypothetical protein